MQSRPATVLARAKQHKKGTYYEEGVKAVCVEQMRAGAVGKVRAWLEEAHGVAVPTKTLYRWHQAARAPEGARDGRDPDERAFQTPPARRRGRLKAIPDEVTPLVLAKLDLLLEKQNSPTSAAQFDSLIKDALKEYVKHNPQAAPSLNPSPRSLQRYRKALFESTMGGVASLKADWTTKRRTEVKSDPRSWISYLSVVRAVTLLVEKAAVDSKKVRGRKNAEEEIVFDENEGGSLNSNSNSKDPFMAELLWNMDPTTVTMPSEQRRVDESGVIVTTRAAAQGKVVRLADDGAHGTFRVCCAGNAAGYVMPPVTSVKDPTQARFVCANSAYAPGTPSGGTGMIILAKQPTSVEVGHEMVMYTLRHMADFRARHAHLAGRRMALFLDGAADNTKDVTDFIDGKTESSNILACCEANNIILAKLPGSSTGFSQPFDVGSCFRATKSSLRAAMPRDTNDEVQTNMLAQVSHLQAVVRDHSRMGPGPRKTVAVLLSRLNAALDVGLRKDLVRKSFHSAGYYPFDAEARLDAFKGSLGHDLTTRQAAAAVERLALVYISNGRLCEKDYEDEGFITTELEYKRAESATLVSRDDRAITQQRAVILSHRELIRARAAEMEERRRAAAAKKVAEKERRQKAELAKKQKERRERRAAETARLWEAIDIDDRRSSFGSVQGPDADDCHACGLTQVRARFYGVENRPTEWCTGCKHCGKFATCPMCQTPRTKKVLGAHIRRCAARKKAKKRTSPVAPPRAMKKARVGEE